MNESDEIVFVDGPESESGVDFEFVVVPDSGALAAAAELAQRNLPFYFARDTLVRGALIAGRREELANPVRVAAGERATWQELVERSETASDIVVAVPEGKRLTVSLQDEPQGGDRVTTGERVTWQELVERARAAEE